ncbi:MAG: hypothetical protein RBG13Loki_0809 [Promethearchaeota archaeon CR_4]|nr:MAG: hypothetical protein RBG13Loki_0809 [Candidatus Lokiarchaeota archaeon CR_4]
MNYLQIPAPRANLTCSSALWNAVARNKPALLGAAEPRIVPSPTVRGCRVNFKRGEISRRFMSPKTKSSQDLFPSTINPAELQKGLGCGANLLSRPVSKRPNPRFQPGTGPKLLNTIVVQMVAKLSAGASQQLLDLFQFGLRVYSKAILVMPDPIATLTEVTQLLSSEDAPSMFSVSPPTLSAHLDRFPVAEADAAFREHLEAIEAQMRKQGTWPGEFMLAADPTDVVYRGRFRNQYTSYGRTGNQPTWKRGFKEFGIYACPSQLQVGFAPLPVGRCRTIL